jgi:hypothetical protein
MSSTSVNSNNKMGKKLSSNPFKWVRPKSDSDPPKKPLSSYNIYFLLERDRIVNGDEVQRMYTTEEVQNIVEQQKWNYTYRKRQHRKTHGKVSFHDLSSVVANNWRQLGDEQKAIFNHQASIEKKIYKQALNAWVMKQMKQGQNHTIKERSHRGTGHREPLGTRSFENKNVINEQIMTTITVDDYNDKISDDNMPMLSSDEMKFLLGCFNMLPSSNQSSTTADTVPNPTLYPQEEAAITNSNHGYIHHDPNDWIRLDGSGPLWYDEHQLKGCSEEFALQMIHNDNYNTNTNHNGQMYHHTTTLDRAITL